MHIVTDVFPVMRVQNLPLITCGTGDNIKATGGRRQHWCQWKSFHWSIVYTVGASFRASYTPKPVLFRAIHTTETKTT